MSSVAVQTRCERTIYTKVTWADLKRELETDGIRDDDVIDWIHIAGSRRYSSARIWRGCDPLRTNPTINPFKRSDEQLLSRENSYDVER